jgi:dimethylglycine catabolism A
VIGAGPAGLTYASLVADGNSVTVFERAPQAGGAFRHAGKAPLFQEVRANPLSFTRYVDGMVALCTVRGVTFRYATDVAAAPDLLAPFDRVVIATGARYRFGLGALVTALLDAGVAHWPGLRQVFSNPACRDWFYYRGRRATGEALRSLARPDQKVVVIGDAATAGKSRDAIASAFEAALRG